jgi:hypothetical protein
MKLKIRLHHRNGCYEVLVIVTKSMFENLKKYGDVISITYNFVPTKRNRLSRCHYLGLFTGINHCGNMVVFGAAVIVGSTPEFKAEVIGHFLKLVHPIRPYCMIGECSK